MKINALIKKLNIGEIRQTLKSLRESKAEKETLLAVNKRVLDLEALTDQMAKQMVFLRGGNALGLTESSTFSMSSSGLTV